VDGSLPDGMAQRTGADNGQGGSTGNSLDPNGNMGDVGRTGKPVYQPDAGVDAASNTGAEGRSGSDKPDEDHAPQPPLGGESAPPP
jgi:hypothetical protein